MVSSSSSVGGRNWKEIGRVVNGLSLVAKELAKRSSAAAAGIGGREATTTGSTIETLIRSTAKKALVSATDLAGLTKGSPISIHHFNSPPTPQEQHHHVDSQNTQDSSSSVVYFHNHKEDQQQQPPLSSSSSSDDDDDNKTNCDTTATSTTNTSSITTSSVATHPVIPTTTPTEDSVAPARPSSVPNDLISTTPPSPRRKPRERKVPSTPFSRALGFAGLGAGLAWGTLQESAKRLAFGSPPPGNNSSSSAALSPFLSDKNAERLALALCRMRGAALKIGQMLSIQDESLVPPPILAALEVVRQGADVMPRNQLNQVLDAELGNDWSSKLTSFDYGPIAAASIGQVHRAVTKDGLQIAMKIQYPGVANSIDSDIENVKLLLNYTNLIPKGLYLDRAIKVAKEELSRECDYLLEAKNQKHFSDLLSGTEGFYVPAVVDDLSSKRVLTSELVAGIPIDKVALLDQETRNYVGKRLLELTLLELFVFRFMQTDPNWGNFLYDETRKTLNLIDFGAARDYPKSFVNNYIRMVVACANGDRNTIIEMSCRLGFLSGEETEIMLDAHVQAGLVVGLPFSKAGGYDFRSANITQSLSNLGATMLKHRLRPPPDEAYSLHRKLSGAFLACIKLGAVVPCRELLFQVYENHQFGEDNGEVVSSGSASR